MKTPPPAKTRQTGVAGFSLRRVNGITPNLPPRHRNHGGSVSPPSAPVKLDRKTTLLLKQYEDYLHVRYAEKTARGYLTVLRHHLAWLLSRGLALLPARRQHRAA